MEKARPLQEDAQRKQMQAEMHQNSDDEELTNLRPTPAQSQKKENPVNQVQPGDLSDIFAAVPH